ncbi:MAG: putative binding protein [Nocardioidaceae bacterium]|nr:putative binding protein [Nocardioidaceae bacterium]
MSEHDSRAAHRNEIREFLTSRRARITPAQAGLPAYGGNRRVKGLRREEVAMLSGVSVDYYVRMERGDLSGASDSVLESMATALQLDEAEHDHLFALARAAGPSKARPQTPTRTVRPAVQQVLDAMSEAPAWVRNGRHDIIAMNPLAKALYSPVLESRVAGPSGRRPANTTRFVYLDPAARDFFVDYDLIARDAAAMLRQEAGRNPHDVKFHRNGRKRLRHPIVGELDLDFEAMDLPSEPGLCLNVYTAPIGTPTADALRLLASWAASQHVPTPLHLDKDADVS